MCISEPQPALYHEFSKATLDPTLAALLEAQLSPLDVGV